jgi:hypothetical protein
MYRRTIASLAPVDRKSFETGYEAALVALSEVEPKIRRAEAERDAARVG